MMTLWRIGWITLKRDRVALLLSFVLPVIFFSIFAAIFSNSSGGMSKVKVVLVDEDQSPESRRLVDALRHDSSLNCIVETGNPPAPISRKDGSDLVAHGNAAAMVALPEGFGQSLGLFMSGGVAAELIYDEADPVAPQIVMGLLQKSAMTAAPDLMARRGIEMFEKYGGPLTSSQQEAMDFFLPKLQNQSGGSADPSDAASATSPTDESSDEPAFSGPVQVKARGIHSNEAGEIRSYIAYTASGIAVMFLLFSMSGAAGTFLEDQESGVLERIVVSRLTMGQILLGKWSFIALMGIAQLTLMFLWAWAVFKVDLFKPDHFAGWLVMTVVTAGAAAGFGMMLATLCRSRAQLAGVSTILILLMSATGGSMVPRFVMSPTMQSAGLASFNAWAIDGFQKVFWYKGSGHRSITQVLVDISPQVAVIVSLCIAFLVVARILARRWETV